MDYLVSGSGQRVYDGSIVMLARFPGIKWIVRNGWYSYHADQCMGWYVSSIPSQTTMPLTEEDLTLLTVISDDSSHPCPCPPQPGPKPIPVPPEPNPEIDRINKYLDKTFITVDTIEERDQLKFDSAIPDGKLVRVNHAGEDDEVKYYQYNKATYEFEEIDLEGASKEDVQNLENDLTAMSWQYL